MEPDRAGCVRQRVGARQPVQQRLPPRGRAARCASSRGRCGPVRERRRASNRRVSGGAHGSARRLLVETRGSSQRDRFPRDELPCRQLAADASPRGFAACVGVSTMYRRVQRCVSNLSRGTGGLARSVGEAMMIGRGVGVALFSRELRTPAPRNCGSWNVWQSGRCSFSEFANKFG